MKPENIMNTAFDIARNSHPEHFDHFQKNWRMYKRDTMREALPVLYHCANLVADALEEMDKKSSKPSKLAAAKRIVANCPRENLRGIWIDELDRTCMCDGFRAVRVFDSFSSLPTVQGWQEMPRIFEDPVNYTRAIDLPTVTAIKKIAAEQRAANGKNHIPSFDFGEDLPMVSCEYLIDMLSLLPGCTAYVADRKTEKSPIYFKADNGDGILMPVRKNRREN